MVLQVDVPTYVDMQAAVLWSASLQSSDPEDREARRGIGRRVRRGLPLGLSGQGFVVVQASEGHPPPARR